MIWLYHESNFSLRLLLSTAYFFSQSPQGTCLIRLNNHCRYRRQICYYQNSSIRQKKQDTWTNNSDFFILKTRPERNSLTIIMISQGSYLHLRQGCLSYRRKSLSTETMWHSSGKPPCHPPPGDWSICSIWTFYSLDPKRYSLAGTAEMLPESKWPKL